MAVWRYNAFYQFSPFFSRFVPLTDFKPCLLPRIIVSLNEGPQKKHCVVQLNPLFTMILIRVHNIIYAGEFFEKHYVFFQKKNPA